jgi:cytochrome c oxidase subunit IV
MSWVTIIWSMVAPACLTLAVMHLLVWCRNRMAWADAAYALAATVQVVLECCNSSNGRKRRISASGPSSGFWCPTKP